MRSRGPTSEISSAKASRTASTASSPAPGEEELLNPARLLLEPHPRHQIGVEIARRVSHPADVEAEHRLDGQQPLGDVVADADVGHGRDEEAFAQIGERGLVRLGAGRRPVQRQPAVRDTGRLRHVLRTFGAEQNGQFGTERMRDRLQCLAESHAIGALVRVGVEASVEFNGPFAPEDLAYDIDVLPGRGQRRLRERAPVPALHDLRPRQPEAEHHAPAREMVEGERVHRGGGGGAGGHLCDGGAQLDTGRPRRDPGEGVKASEPQDSAVHTEW